MGSDPDSISAALFGTVRQGVLRVLFGHTDRRFYQRQLIRALGVGAGGVQRELARLVQAGIVTRAVEGNQAYYQANPACPVAAELAGLIRKTFGVASVLQGALASLGGSVSLAFIYGSVAAGTEKAESDIDVLVIQQGASLDEVVSALGEAQRSLGREINPSVYQPEEFSRKLSEGHHFLSSVVAGPKIFVIGDEIELTRLAPVGLAAGTRGKPAGNRGLVRHRRPRS